MPILSFRTQKGIRRRIDEIAESLDRDRSWIINEAIVDYIELYECQLRQIDEGITELDRGEGYTLDEVRKRLKIARR